MDIRTVCLTIGFGLVLTAGMASAEEPVSAVPPAPVSQTARVALPDEGLSDGGPNDEGLNAQRPLTASVQRAALTSSHLLTQDAPPASPSKGGSCAKRLLGLTAVGAGIGAGSALGLLYATGGSDSTGAIIRNFALTGTVLGLIAGTVACAAA